MPITAFSKTFHRELDVSQLKSLFKKSSRSGDISFRDFVKEDIECPACNVTGGYIVKEGTSPVTGRRVSQEHFAFKNKLGNDAHSRFCEFYNGVDKLKLVANEGKVDFRKSNSQFTKNIGLMVCIAIENNLLTQKDIRDMRQWFLDLRTNGDFSFSISPHLIHLARASYTRTKRNWDNFVPDPIAAVKEGFNIDKEVYESLYHRFSYYNLTPHCKENPMYWDISLKSVVNKAAGIARKDSNALSFDREVLSERYCLTRQLSIAIIKSGNEYFRKLSPSAAIRSNPLMAFSALLLFVSDWDYDQAWEKVETIYEIKTVKDSNIGNVIGLNPFINYSAWVIIKKLNALKNEMNDETNYEEEFNLEKARLMKLYNLEE